MTYAHNGHTHAVDLEAFLDLVNTVELTDGVPEEHLPTVDDAIAFFDRRGIAHRDALAAAVEDERSAGRHLARLRSVRAAGREVWDALVEDRDPDPSAVDRVNDALRHRPVLELIAGEPGCVVGHRHAGDPWDEALARTLEPFVHSVASDATDRFRVCANDGCRWVFYDESRAGRRRWCNMASCGNRAKAARHRARKKSQAAEPAGLQPG
jgi:predicted RNA-binding Zn ribbon-like protein